MTQDPPSPVSENAGLSGNEACVMVRVIYLNYHDPSEPDDDWCSDD